MDIKQKIIDALQKASGVSDITLDVPEISEFGDYSSNVALQVNGRNPRETADEIIQKLQKDKKLEDIVEKIEVAGAGFINFYLTRKYLLNQLKYFTKGEFEIPQIGKGKTVVIDYSSPNIAKRFSVGHLRSTIIGQSLYNLYSELGWKVIGDNHLGDWGTQFGVLIYMVRENNLDPAKLTVAEWEKLYVDFHDQLADKPELKEKSRDAFKALESGDPEAKKIWKAALDTSMMEYQEIYDRLDVKIDYSFGESFYEDKMPQAIEKAIHKGVVVKSGEALAVEFKKYKLPSNLLIKSNGTTTYLARDLALMYFRKKEWNPDLQIFEVGADQDLYFKQVFALAEMMGLFKLDQLKHIGHGMIRLKEGTMSTRKGKTIKLEDLLENAILKAKEIRVNTFQTDNKGRLKITDPKHQQIQDIDNIVGIGAVKWNDLKRDPKTEIVFDWDEILNMEGNSGPYMQYTFARSQSVINKAVGNKQLAVGKLEKLSKEENELLRAFAQYSGVIVRAARNYSPNLLCNYLYNLAQKFNSFYNAHKIVGGENEEFRLALTSATANVLKHGLGILGVQAPEKM